MNMTTRKTQSLLRAALCLGMVFSLHLSAATPDHSRLDATLPQELYKLPENMPLGEPENSNSDEIFFGMKKMLRALDTYFEADTDALDKVPTIPDAPNPPSDLVKWRLSALTTEISISIKGLIAPLALKGTAGLKVLFRKKQTPPPVDAEKVNVSEVASTDEGAPALVLSDSMTRDEMIQQLEPLISMVIKTKKVQDGKLFRDSMYEEANQFYELSQVLADDPGTPWWVARFRLDLWVAASGKVQPNVSVGGEFKLRFERFRLKPTGRGFRPQLASGRSTRDKNFQEFVEAMSYDAQSVSADHFTQTGFYPNSLKIGIGMNATGNFGVVKFGGGICGYLYFQTVAKEPTDSPREMAMPASAMKPLLVMERNPPEQHLAYARANNIPFEVIQTHDGRGIINDIIYKIDRMRFRAGLSRAAKMAGRMAERAKTKGDGKRWKIHEIRPNFELSIGGEFKLVSVNGFANMELSLYNGNF